MCTENGITLRPSRILRDHGSRPRLLRRSGWVRRLAWTAWLAGGGCSNVWAAEFDMRPGVTDISRRVLDLHHLSLWICVVVGLIVFGAMFYSMFRHHHTRHPTASQFHDNTLLEIVWTAIPVLILVVMAIPATSALIDIEDNSDADLTIQVTGSQWKWHYQYLDAGFGFYSLLTTPQEQIGNQQPKGEYYLLETDRHLVLPVDRKIRFLVTAQDVIHSWWVPDFAVKQDAIPGFINEAWTRIEEPGIYRGQCAELCGRDHAFMPIVVEAKSPEEFDQWLAEEQRRLEAGSAEARAAREKHWTLAELMPIGEQVYMTHCSTCHEPDGAGRPPTYPALAGGPMTTGDVPAHIDRVMNGKADTEMQAWAPQLTDLELAAVITFERNSWGNETGEVIQPMTIYELR